MVVRVFFKGAVSLVLYYLFPFVEPSAGYLKVVSVGGVKEEVRPNDLGKLCVYQCWLRKKSHDGNTKTVVHYTLLVNPLAL